jgi:hypothetical protein
VLFLCSFPLFFSFLASLFAAPSVSFVFFPFCSRSQGLIYFCCVSVVTQASAHSPCCSKGSLVGKHYGRQKYMSVVHVEPATASCTLWPPLRPARSLALAGEINHRKGERKDF